MGESLTGQTPKDTYKQLAHWGDEENFPADGETPLVLLKGDGTASPISATQSKLFVNGIEVGFVSSINILAAPYNAVGDGMRVDAAAMTAGSATLTTDPIFVTGDVGKYIRVEGAGVAGADLITTIAAYTSSTQVTLANSASTTVAAKSAFFGTDNTTAIQAAIDDAIVSPTTRTVYVPPGVYLCNVVLKKNIKIIGSSSTVTDQTILNTTAIQSREHASILLPAVSTAAVIRANVDSFGCEVRDLNIVGSLTKVGYGVLGGNGWGNTGYSFGNANFEGLHVGGFAVAIGTTNATEVTVKRCSCNDSLTAFEIWNIDSVSFEACNSAGNDYTFRSGGSKNTTVISGDYNQMDVFAYLQDSQMSVISVNVEICAEEVFGLHVVSGTCYLTVDYVKVLGGSGILVRDYNLEATKAQTTVDIRRANGALYYDTVNSRFPETLPRDITMRRYANETWATLQLTEFSNDFFLPAKGHNQPKLRIYEKFGKAYTSPFGILGWIHTVITGTWGTPASWTAGGLRIANSTNIGATASRFIVEQPWVISNDFRAGFRIQTITDPNDGVGRVGFYSKDASAALVPQYGFGLKFSTADGDAVVYLEKTVNYVKTQVATTLAKATAFGGGATVDVVFRVLGGNVYMSIYTASSGVLLCPEVSLAYTTPPGYLSPALLIGSNTGAFISPIIQKFWMEE